MDIGEELGKEKGLARKFQPSVRSRWNWAGFEIGAGDDEDVESGLDGFDLEGEVHAGAVGHGVVGDEEIDVVGAAENLCGSVGVARGVDVVALVLEEGAGEGTDVCIIVDYEDSAVSGDDWGRGVEVHLRLLGLNCVLKTWMRRWGWDLPEDGV